MSGRPPTGAAVPAGTREPAGLPVREALPALARALRERGAAVLCAPPGTGKTTWVPLALAGLVDAAPDGLPAGEPARRVLVAEPRRMAARAAARRMAWLLGESPGQRVGFTVRGERRVSARTVVEVVTTGVLLQRLQRDQELTGVDLVLLDECHERQLEADTAAAFLCDVRATLRPDLRLLAASATTDAEGWAELLAAEVVVASGVSHPVRVVWAPPDRPVRPPHGTWVDPALLEHVAAVARRALRECDGDVLCFLPGTGELTRVARRLASSLPPDVEVLAVHGRAPAEVQDAVLAGSGDGRRRVVLATSVAESSLTVPGVRVVVDAGLAREPRTDHARGLSALTTVRASRAAVRQRAGRAGREAPGVVYRCWSEAEDARLPHWPSPQIAVADLTGFALAAACWGDPYARDLALLDPPPGGAMAAAGEVLAAIGAVDGRGRVTGRGERLARVGVHPRLARALLDASPVVGARRAAELVALLSEEPPAEWGDDLVEVWRAVRRGGDGYAVRWRQEVRRLRSAVAAVEGQGSAAVEGREDSAGDPSRAGADADAGVVAGSAGGRGTGGWGDAEAAGLVAALAFPERVAAARGPGSFLMVSGTRAEPGPGSRLRGARWLAVAVADRPVGAASARIRRAAEIDEETARLAAGALLDTGARVRWSTASREVTARWVERLGAVELASRALPEPNPEEVRAALLEGLRLHGLDALGWTARARALRHRLAFLHREVGEPWPDVSDEALLDGADRWLTEVRRLDQINTEQLVDGLLPWSSGAAAQLAELAPERLEVPSGSRVRIDYGGERPVLAVKLQELFGWQASPRIAGGRVALLVHLLSPAGRPVAVTADLASFWREGYRSVRAELRGRYPRHPWPEDPTEARATRRTNPRR